MSCALNKDKILTASLLAKTSDGGVGHFKIVERLEVSIALVIHQSEGGISLDETDEHIRLDEC